MSTAAKLDCKEILKAVRAILEPMYGERLRGLVLYGSVARGDYDEDSDVDILVLLSDVGNFGEELWRLVGAVYDLSWEKLGRPISVKPVSEDIFKSSLYPLYVNARREGIAG